MNVYQQPKIDYGDFKINGSLSAAFRLEIQPQISTASDLGPQDQRFFLWFVGNLCSFLSKEILSFTFLKI